ncbi:HPr-rel-A system PqqD family peptide chaperone [Dechloromonas sp. XY25]|uniref:HPr-rel-A system PqqD family peptide chaperone n=1 Tax=Dechloromonas hankyongensis TaxID=2908002 RepID=A0ABS9K3Q5_9RHOO|nr:HPr-rel-A system PqqD family peptide chaperone [Dechloromonas hankyongensis]MCG2577776.1 HPr-rel-A system PqqD family peptide chaperone [Dechloromonas hankyongensis]
MAHTRDIEVRRIQEQFATRRLSEEIALFNIKSGKTHLLDASLVAVFDLLGDIPKTKASLIAEATPLASLYQDDIENFIDHALHELQDIGLIDVAETP